jgi:formylglycine-generating enzyme required for sulfatase activity
MDGRILFLLFILISGCAVLKKNPTKGNPPGTVQINDTLYVDQTEVANVHWREYWYYLNRFDSANACKALPDTTVWINWEPDSTGVINLNNALSDYYFRHPSFNNYPAVGISYEQAVEFCKWRTLRANEGDYFRENNIKDYLNHLHDSFPIRYYYRLPTKEEWEMIAAGKFSIKNAFGERESFSKWRNKQFRSFNCIYPNDTIKLHDEILYTADVKSYFKNSFGCYNMIGNVSEMVSEKGIAKGGSFYHQLDSCKIMNDQHYSDPQMWLGLRCVAVKIK